MSVRSLLKNVSTCATPFCFRPFESFCCELRDPVEVVWAAVQESGLALEHAADELRRSAGRAWAHLQRLGCRTVPDSLNTDGKAKQTSDLNWTEKT